MKHFTVRLHDKLEQHKRELADKQREIDRSMKELLEQREKMTAIAKRKVETIILPRMKELALIFDNTKVEVIHADENYSCYCEFSHTPRFPATVRLGITLLPGHRGTLTARYDLSILPVLMPYDRNFEETFPLEGGDEPLASWVEDRIVYFVDTYLHLEIHPLYQKDNTVLDIVCGMRIPSASAACTVERNGRTFYFCSEHCKEAFVKEGA